jgi:hypothetical protein
MHSSLVTTSRAILAVEMATGIGMKRRITKMMSRGIAAIAAIADNVNKPIALGLSTPCFWVCRTLDCECSARA